jgi:hypothetical protein
MRHWLLAQRCKLWIVLALLPNFATTVYSQTTTCNPTVTNNSGSVSLTFNCPVSLSHNYLYSIDEKTFDTIAKYYSVNSIAIKNFFRLINEENIPPYQVEKRLERIALQIKHLSNEAAEIQINEKTKADVDDAQRALSNGDIDTAITAYRSALTKTLSDEREAIKSLGLIADIRQSTAELLMIKLKYKEAAELVKQSMDNIPASLVSKTSCIVNRIFRGAILFSS